MKSRSPAPQKPTPPENVWIREDQTHEKPRRPPRPPCGSFSPLYIRAVGNPTGTPQYRLARRLKFSVGFNGHGGILITIPAGFITDFASVPRFLWAILPHDGPWAPAAVVHDFLYSHHSACSRFLADAVFRDGMATLKVPLWRRWLMWLAVRAWGWRYFEEGTEAKP